MHRILFIGPRSDTACNRLPAIAVTHACVLDEVVLEGFEDARADDESLSIIVAEAGDADGRSGSFLRLLATRRLRCPVLAILPQDASPELIAAASNADDFLLAPVRADARSRVVTIDWRSFGHLYLPGAPRSGRSQALRTMAAMVARYTSSADVHLFGIDCGNGALLPLAELPHCGAVVTRTQDERAARLESALPAR